MNRMEAQSNQNPVRKLNSQKFKDGDEVTEDTVFIIQDTGVPESNPNTEHYYSSATEDTLDVFQAQAVQTHSPMDPIGPQANIQILESKYSKPINVIAYFDTGAHTSMMNPKVLPAHAWIPHVQYFRAADGFYIIEVLPPGSFKPGSGGAILKPKSRRCEGVCLRDLQTRIVEVVMWLVQCSDIVVYGVGFLDTWRHPGGVLPDGEGSRGHAQQAVRFRAELEDGDDVRHRLRLAVRLVEILRRKMEGLSKGMLFERMEEEYGSMLSTNTSAASSASTSKPIEFPDVSSLPIRQLYKVMNMGT
ncbi:hypothetical protein LWI29_016500 [Acer saccharum]|uniref:Uncharacterized protein n=1 Tax=Acer saccharum TaxID=4024 RepID=A0AA39TAQ1_ACESA|nr:hypothetical protein LWI29_016500 [Acer saccharum]